MPDGCGVAGALVGVGVDGILECADITRHSEHSFEEI
jgi:hypothetical protein